MKKLFLSLFCSALIFTQFTACGNTNKPPDTPTSEVGSVDIPETIGDVDDEEMLIKQPEDKQYELVYPGPIKYNEENSAFKFTDEEIKAYEKYSETMDKNDLKGLDPKTVFKFYIQYSVDGGWQQEYSMFAKDTLKEGLTEQTWFNFFMTQNDRMVDAHEVNEEIYNDAVKNGTLPEGQKKPELLTRKILAGNFFSNIDDGEITISEDESTASIVFQNDVEKITLNLVKNKELDIWEIPYESNTQSE